MSIHYRIKGEYVLIVGHTYPHRDAIRSLGGFFDRDEKVWKLLHSDAALQHIEALCQRLGGGVLGLTDSNRERPKAATSALMVSTPPTVLATRPDAAGLTVSELMARVQLTIAQAFPQAVWVVGEVQNANLRGGALFFQLAEAKNQETKAGTVTINATMWSSVQKTLSAKLKVSDLLADGMQVRLLCQVGLYKDRGSVSLNVLDVDPLYTKGALALAREQLLKELRSQGLDQKNKRIMLTDFPFTLGLISADESRAKSDFLNQLETYGYSGKVFFADARMQGERIVPEVLRAFKAMLEAGVDCIIITRGGGSAADLRWFDHRDIALGIAHCPVPVIAAIGHHDDVCVAEMIAFQREKTPTAAADFILNRLKGTREKVEQASQTMSLCASRRIEQEARIIAKLREHLALASLNFLERKRDGLARYGLRLRDVCLTNLTTKGNTVTQALQRLNMQALNFFTLAERRVSQLESALKAKDPKPWLEKGWTQLFTEDSKQVQKASQLRAGEKVHARLIDGRIEATITGIDIKKG